MEKKRRRRNWSDDEKRRIVAQTQISGVSVSQVARRYDVNANLVFTWLRDPRFRPNDETCAQFFPIEVVPDAVVAGSDLSVSGGAIEILLNNGHRLSLTGAFDTDAVCRLVRGLSK